MTGIDHSENPETKFYETSKKNIRIRKEPNAHNSFLIDREWKSKGRVDESYKDQYGFPHGKWVLERKFNNDDAHGYNIVTNRRTSCQE